MSSKSSRTSILLAIVTLVIGIIIGLALSPVILGPLRETVVVTQPTVTIRISMGWTGKEREPFDAAVQEYLRRNPNVRIEYIVYRAEDLAAILPAQLEAKTYPAEIMVTPWSWFIVDLAKKGHIEDLSDDIPLNEFLQDYVKLVTYDGKVYGVPIGLYFKELYWYRISLFQQYGLKEPRSWDEFIALLDTLKARMGTKRAIVVGDTLGWPASDIVESFILAFGGADMHRGLTNGSIRFNDPRVQSIFRDRLVPLIKAGYFSEPIEWTTAKERWWAKEYAIYPLGSFLQPMLDDPNDADFFTLPGIPDMIGNVDFLFVPKYLPDDIKPIVLDLLRFLATEGQAIMSSYPAGRVPTWTRADPSKVHPVFRELYQMAVEGRVKFVPDMDDTVGGEWQRLFWEYCKTLFVNPDIWSEMLETLTQQHPAIKK